MDAARDAGDTLERHLTYDQVLELTDAHTKNVPGFAGTPVTKYRTACNAGHAPRYAPA